MSEAKQKVKKYKNLNRAQWAQLKLKSVRDLLPNNTVSDIGAGWGNFETMIKDFNLQWRPFDYVKKIEKATVWDLNNPAPVGSESPGFFFFFRSIRAFIKPRIRNKKYF